ncbi:MAG: hypothetical protein ACYTGB_10895 [Planctomycetota bacterium]|jgi:hypothetical protein
MEVVRDGDGGVVSIELTRDEMRELLAYEATCACLLHGDARDFLEDIRRHYDIPEGDMAAYFRKERFGRDDVWRLQILKRSVEGRYEAVHVIGDLRRLESQLGAGALETYVNRRKILPLT